MPNPPSEDRRLHPASVLFELAAHLRRLVLPGLFVLLAGARGGETWQLWLIVMFLPLALLSIARTLVFRYRMDPEELVIQSGLIFRHQRHVPYERIQNIDAVQNVFHRALRVVDVRLETAGGQEPEGQLRVVSLAAFEELRTGVRVRRGETVVQDETGPPLRVPVPLLQLTARELVVSGLIQGRGLIVIGALFGLMWETGLFDRMTTYMFGDVIVGRGVMRQLMRALVGEGMPSWRRIAATLGAFAGFLVLTRAFSVGWSLVRLHGFTLSRSGEDLRTDFGLFTRVAATIPMRRIQSVTVLEGPLHRLFGRVSVRVETAGGTDESVQLQRQWLAPVLPPERVPALLEQILPAVDAAAVEWQPVEGRGLRRLRGRSAVKVALLSLPLFLVLGRFTPILSALLLLAGEFNARRSIRALGWGATDSAVFFRSGWLWRRQTVAPFAKIQAVSLQESPFDRRQGMATVVVDTAGMGADGHRIHVPFLSRPVAAALSAGLAVQAARTTFRW